MDQSCICRRQDKMHNQAVKRWAHLSFGRLQRSESSPAIRASHPPEQGFDFAADTVACRPGSRFCNPGEEKTTAKLCILAKRDVLFAIQREQFWHALVLHYAARLLLCSTTGHLFSFHFLSPAPVLSSLHSKKNNTLCFYSFSDKLWIICEKQRMHTSVLQKNFPLSIHTATWTEDQRWSGSLCKSNRMDTKHSVTIKCLCSWQGKLRRMLTDFSKTSGGEGRLKGNRGNAERLSQNNAWLG